jgi:hypothetical protein
VQSGRANVIYQIVNLILNITANMPFIFSSEEYADMTFI